MTCDTDGGSGAIALGPDPFPTRSPLVNDPSLHGRYPITSAGGALEHLGRTADIDGMRPTALFACFASLAIAAIALSPLRSSARATARAAASSSAAQASAPLDEYFGRMKLSPIGIGNELHLIATRSRNASDARNSLPLLTLLEDSMHDWEHRYPHDDWIPMNLARLEHDYLLVPTLGGRIHAMHVIEWLRSDYPGSPALDRAQREAERAMGIPTPTPSPVASSTPQPEASAEATPEASATPTP